MRLTALAMLLALLAGPAGAVEPDEILKDPALEARARAISAELRCLVCQNQSIDDSQAGLAKDLRLIVRERLQAGDTDSEVKRFLVARYGDFVLLRPPFEPETILLWTSPFILLAAGGAVLLFRRRTGQRTVPLTAEEEAQLASLLREPDRR